MFVLHAYARMFRYGWLFLVVSCPSKKGSIGSIAVSYSSALMSTELIPSAE